MVLCDVNVLLYACTSQSSHHQVCYKKLLELTSAGEKFAVNDVILAAVVRLATNPRIFNPPASAESVFKFTDALLAHPDSVAVVASSRHWRIFKDLILTSGVRGKDTTDAYLAALAMEHGCEWWTTDSDFSRFHGLRWRNLLAS